MHIAAGIAAGRERTCGTKIGYSSEASAQGAAAAMNGKPGTRNVLEAYPCAFCNKWHVGRKMSEDELRAAVSEVTRVPVSSRIVEARPARVDLPPSEEKWGHILEMFELGDGPIGTGQRHCVWFHALKAGGYRWRCSCGAESRHEKVSAALFAEARMHFEQPWQPAAVPIGTAFAIWNDRVAGQPPPTIDDLVLLAQEFAEEEADVTPLRPRTVEIEVVHRCGLCGQTFQISKDDPHWSTGRGPICPAPRTEGPP